MQSMTHSDRIVVSPCNFSNARTFTDLPRRTISSRRDRSPPRGSAEFELPRENRPAIPADFSPLVRRSGESRQLVRAILNGDVATFAPPSRRRRRHDRTSSNTCPHVLLARHRDNCEAKRCGSFSSGHRPFVRSRRSWAFYIRTTSRRANEVAVPLKFPSRSLRYRAEYR